MPLNHKPRVYQVANGAAGSVTFAASGDASIYQIVAAAPAPALSGALSFTFSGTPKEGMLFHISYNAGIVLNGFTLTIFGRTIIKEMALMKLLILAYYNGSAWVTTIHPDWGLGGEFIKPPDLDPAIVDNATLEITSDIHIKDEGVTLAKLADITQAYLIIGSATSRPFAVAISGDVTITDAGVVTIGNQKIGTVKIEDKAATLDKLQDITRGHIVAGNSLGRPVLIDAKTSAYILLGDGTDLISVTLSGDVTISATGAVTIGAQKITTAKIADANVTMAKIENLTSGMIIVGNASNRPVAVTPSGDVDVSSTGVITLKADAVSVSKIPDGELTVDKVAHKSVAGGITDGLAAVKTIGGAELKAKLDAATNALFNVKAGDIVLAVIFFTQTASGVASLVFVGPNAAARSAGADDDGILKDADANVLGSYISYMNTYMGALQSFGWFKADADGLITIRSAANLSASAFVGGVIMYYIPNN